MQNTQLSSRDKPKTYVGVDFRWDVIRALVARRSRSQVTSGCLVLLSGAFLIILFAVFLTFRPLEEAVGEKEQKKSNRYKLAEIYQNISRASINRTGRRGVRQSSLVSESLCQVFLRQFHFNWNDNC